MTVAKTVNDDVGTATDFTYKIVFNTPGGEGIDKNWTYTSLADKVLTGTITVADVEPGNEITAVLGTDGTLQVAGKLSYEWHRVSADRSDDIVGTDASEYVTQDTDDGCSFYVVVKDEDGAYVGWVKSSEGKCESPKVVKYAVQLLDIMKDKDENGNTLGLTFGPATGDNYATTHKASCGSEHCIHTDSWETINTLASSNPHAYDNCLNNNCTATVELNINDTIGSGTYQQASGDGYGALSACIKDDYRKWNGTTEFSSSGNKGGWAASWIRRTLNGSDNCTDTDFNTSVTQPGTPLTSSQALISCFPSELQQAIKAKAVKTRTTYNNSKVATTSDKLWLLSYAEISTNGNNYTPTNEGSKYSTKFSSVTNAWTNMYTVLIAYVDTTSSASGAAGSWWLRSSSAYSGGGALGVGAARTVSGYYGEVGGYAVFNALALAPCFCLGVVSE